MTTKLLSGNLYGDLLKRTTISELTLTETQYSPLLNIPKHSHENTYFCFVLKGSFTEKYDNKFRLCEPCSLIIHPQGEEHSDKFHNHGGKCFNVQLSQKLLNYVSDYSSIFNQSLHFSATRLTELVKKLYREFYKPDKASVLAIEGLTLELIAQISRQKDYKVKGKPSIWLKQAKELLQDQFQEQITLNSIAEQVNIHPVHLAREFRHHYKVPVGEYIRQLRVEFSCRELALTDIPIAEIALKAGFFDQSHFCKTFKRLTGQTPTEFRTSSYLR